MKLIKADEADQQAVSHDQAVQKTVFLKSGEVPDILQWARSALKPGQGITRHLHPDAREIFHVLEGGMRVTVNDQEWQVPANSVLIIDPGETHAFYNDGNEDCVFIYTLMRCHQIQAP